MTTRLTFVPAMLAHAEAIAPRMSFTGDALNAVREYGYGAVDIAREAVKLSSHAWAAIAQDGTVIALFGLWHPSSAFGGLSIIGHAGEPLAPWAMLSIDAQRMKRTVWCASREGLELLLSVSPNLHGHVDGSFRRSIAWLKRLGFKTSAPQSHARACLVTFDIDMRKG